MTATGSTLVELYQKIIDALPMGILFVDTNLHVRVINNCYATQLGGDVQSILGKYLPDLNPGTYARRVMERNQPEMGDMCTLPSTGNTLKFIVNRIPLSTESGQVMGMVSHIMFTDPNQLKSLNDKINELLNRVDFYKKSINSILRQQYSIERIIGEGEAIRTVKQHILRYASSTFPVLIRGATGTGKELTAHAIHTESPQREGPFISINCAAIPKDLFETELFGYASGAFSGANRDGKPGQIELADNGTLFLDEIGDMPQNAQTKLLRVLEDKRVTRVGSVKSHKVNFRLISATNRNLEEMVRQGTFREDLYYRICALTIHLPPLAERKEDILPIANHILSQIGYGHVGFTPRAMQAMKRYSWPGNVRQLFNVLVHASLHCQANLIDVQDLPGELVQAPASLSTDDDLPLADYLARQEERFLRKALQRHGGNVSAMARQLGISRVTLYNKFKKYHLNPTAEHEDSTC